MEEIGKGKKTRQHIREEVQISEMTSKHDPGNKFHGHGVTGAQVIRAMPRVDRNSV